MNEGHPRRPYFLRRQLVEHCESLLASSAAEDLDIREIMKLTESSPPLKRRVLQAANAASNGLIHHVESTEQAVSLLGARRISMLLRRILAEGRPAMAAERAGESSADSAS